MAAPNLDRSEAIAREALRAFLRSAVPEDLTIEGRPFEVVDDSENTSGDVRPLIVRWKGGEVALRLQIGPDGPAGAAAKRGDEGHILGLGIFGKGNRSFLWTTFEWAVRDALRERRTDVPLVFQHIYVNRKDNEDDDFNEVAARRSRAVAARAGLGGDKSITLGTYDLVGRTWDRDDIFHNLLKLALIKAHFMDRGTNRYVVGKPLFPTDDEPRPSPAAPPDEPAAPRPAARRVRPNYVPIDAERVELGGMLVAPDLVERCAAALNAGKHLLLLGSPGTGKSTLACALARHVHAHGGAEGPPLLATATADWTTYETIGGWAQRSDQTLDFHEGVVTSALHEGRWLVLDEINRADIDKCFGELFTVLAGSGAVTTAYTRRVGDRQERVVIGPDAEPFNFGPWFRIVATMNVRDKASLFRLSYAFMRRFAVIAVPGLDDDRLRELAAREGQRLGVAPEIWQLAHRSLSKKSGLGAYLELGPSMLRDVIAYAASRSASPLRAVGEGLDQLVFPQLDGLDRDALAIDVRLGELFAGDPLLLAELRHDLRGYFPHLDFPT